MLKIKTVKEIDFSYNVYRRKKRNGKYRIIMAPCEELKTIQRNFAHAFYDVTKDCFTNEITGFRPGISIKDNAKLHVNKDWVINIDIKDFFPSTTIELVNWALKKANIQEFEGFNLKELTELLTYDGRLPQGSPASPVLANFIGIYFIDPLVKQEVNNLLGPHGFLYTRYADDITISFDDEYKEFNRDVLKAMTLNIRDLIMKETVYKVAPNKINVAYKSQRQKVTGIVVNKKFSINKKDRMNLRAELHQIKLGLKEPTPNLLGRLSFIKQINEELYFKLTKDVLL